jgi:hypothetical protein
MTPCNHTAQVPGRSRAFPLTASPEPDPAPAAPDLHAIERPLAEWHRIYLQLEQARSRLRCARSGVTVPSSVVELQREVDRLGAETQTALTRLNAVLGGARPT